MAVLRGTLGPDRLVGTGADDTLIGLGGDDVLIGSQGNDLLNGGTGLDTAVLAGSVLETTVSPRGIGSANPVVTTGPDGTDRLVLVERIQFDDYLYDLVGNNVPFLGADAASTGEDRAVEIPIATLLANDHEFDGDPLAFQGVDTTGTLGTVTVVDGSVRYDPAGQFEALRTGEAATDTFRYTASDGKGGLASTTVTVTIEGLNELDLDLVIANYDLQPNVWFANDGSGVFGAATNLPSLMGEADTPAISIGDADGDGDLDLFVANDGGRPNLLLLNDSTGSFSAVELPGGALASREIALGDVDGDGDLDAVIANRGSNPQFLRNMGGEPGGTEGVFRLDQTLPSLASGGIDDQALAVALGDLDGDGDLDAVFGTGLFGSEGEAGTRIAINRGGGAPFDLDPQAFAGGSTRDVSLADVDLDGDLDILVANDFFQYSYALLNQGADGGGFVDFEASALLAAGRTRSFGIALGDVDADGDMDALVANTSADDTPSDLLLLNQGLDGNGAWRGFAAGTALNSANSDSRSFALGDLDGDGDLDAILSNRPGSANEAYLNLGGVGAAWAGFAAPYPVGQPMASEDPALGDLDGDGRPPAAGPDGLPVLAADMDLLPSMTVPIA
jgi:VCBS repeat-containing protein